MQRLGKLGPAASAAVDALKTLQSAGGGVDLQAAIASALANIGPGTEPAPAEAKPAGEAEAAGEGSE